MTRTRPSLPTLFLATIVIPAVAFAAGTESVIPRPHGWVGMRLSRAAAGMT